MESISQLNDFVDRPDIHIRRDKLRQLFECRTVLLTGAAGSIGSELSRQLAGLRPERLVLVDMAEHNLYQIQQELARTHSETSIIYCLTDLRNAIATERLFHRHQPDIVIHAAAYKHVPMMEFHPAVAFENNTLATARLLDLSETYGVERFVFVSTDKAVEPTSVLGATKQFSEWYVRSSGDSSMRRSVVRFGNVFGSKGSVIPHFEACLQRGEPLRITHPDMERFFMSVQDACALILETLLLDAYPTYLLQMGAPIRIEWLAQKLVETFLTDEDPADWIHYSEPRPGEKLHERLTTADEGLRAVDHESIVGVDGSPAWRRDELRCLFDDIYSALQDPTTPEQDLRDAILTRSRSSQPAATRPGSTGDGFPPAHAPHANTGKLRVEPGPTDDEDEPSVAPTVRLHRRRES